VKILLDHNLDRRLSGQLSSHEVRTALEMAWDTLKNGALLTEAEKVGFSVLITSDKGIKDQQTMKGRSIGVVVIRAPNNRLETHLTMISDVIEVLIGPASCGGQFLATAGFHAGVRGTRRVVTHGHWELL
jgi:predicted nuclease of predicted toxin-antitoxin system